jgi:hAT family C-terminal dimerisation region
MCLFNRHGSSVSSSVSDIRASLKDFIRVKKISEPIKSELDEYLADALDEASLDDDFDILAWWKLNAPKYLILARLIRDILTVPISKVAS